MKRSSPSAQPASPSSGSFNRRDLTSKHNTSNTRASAIRSFSRSGSTSRSSSAKRRTRGFSRVIHLPPGAVRFFIGPGRHRLQTLRDEYHVGLRVEQREHTLTIRGSREAVLGAERAAHSLLSDYASVAVPVPCWAVGRIIGRKGEGISRICQAAGGEVLLFFPDTTRSISHALIVGMNESVQSAHSQLLSRLGSITEQAGMIVSSHMGEEITLVGLDPDSLHGGLYLAKLAAYNQIDRVAPGTPMGQTPGALSSPPTPRGGSPPRRSQPSTPHTPLFPMDTLNAKLRDLSTQRDREETPLPSPFPSPLPSRASSPSLRRSFPQPGQPGEAMAAPFMPLHMPLRAVAQDEPESPTCHVGGFALGIDEPGLVEALTAPTPGTRPGAADRRFMLLSASPAHMRDPALWERVLGASLSALSAHFGTDSGDGKLGSIGKVFVSVFPGRAVLVPRREIEEPEGTVDELAGMLERRELTSRFILGVSATHASSLVTPALPGVNDGMDHYFVWRASMVASSAAIGGSSSESDKATPPGSRCPLWHHLLLERPVGSNYRPTSAEDIPQLYDIPCAEPSVSVRSSGVSVIVNMGDLAPYDLLVFLRAQPASPPADEAASAALSNVKRMFMERPSALAHSAPRVLHDLPSDLSVVALPLPPLSAPSMLAESRPTSPELGTIPAYSRGLYPPSSASRGVPVTSCLFAADEAHASMVEVHSRTTEGGEGPLHLRREELVDFSDDGTPKPRSRFVVSITRPRGHLWQIPGTDQPRQALPMQLTLSGDDGLSDAAVSVSGLVSDCLDLMMNLH
eukprot:gnl/Dysnectes_brevis/1636_a1862_1217.p1 GENE.gnl/Dysnectes_brevis/1636_a1862_1217~~gnl/Dysnectes_brevis/1636_a1862_1217.p1  ORF type:complete len:799 (+),score=264.32 gnl/Dysnectes_brevis/1636_a1862_1217:14-2410(+)